MSTKTLQTLVGMTGCSGSETCIHCAAQRELDAIRKAAATIVKDDTGDEWAMPEERAEAGHLMERIARETNT